MPCCSKGIRHRGVTGLTTAIETGGFVITKADAVLLMYLDDGTTTGFPGISVHEEMPHVQTDFRPT